MSARVFDLSADGPRLELEDLGFRLHRGGERRAALQLYADVTHVAATQRGLWLATRRRVVFLRRSRFRSPEGPEQLAHELRSRIALSETGARQLHRMAEIERLARHPRRAWATRVVFLVCCAVFLWQIQDVFSRDVGDFDAALAAAGEGWRLVSAHFMHETSLAGTHFVFNMIGLLGFGWLVERVLGAQRVVVILGVAGPAALLVSAWWRDERVIGASGLVAALAGAALAMELRHSDRLPAWWRLPRRLFIGLLIGQAVFDAWVPLIAGEVHAAGFAAGFALTVWLAPGAFDERPAPAVVRWGVAGVLLATLASLAGAVPLARRDPIALTRYGEHLLEVERRDWTRLNAAAWVMATESEASREQLRVARELAERAVSLTRHRDPDVLDTLAEVYFSMGERARAVAVIDEAIQISPGDPYFQEQRRRFTGARAPDDRPEPPPLPWPFRQAPELLPPRDDDRPDWDDGGEALRVRMPPVPRGAAARPQPAFL